MHNNREFQKIGVKNPKHDLERSCFLVVELSGGGFGVGDCVKRGGKWLIFLFGVIFLRNNWILVVYLHLIYKNENLN